MKEYVVQVCVQVDDTALPELVINHVLLSARRAQMEKFAPDWPDHS